MGVLEEILKRLDNIEKKVGQTSNPVEVIPVDNEFVTEEELCKRFAISRPTARKWSKEKKIKVLFFGTSKRYRWSEVLAKLDK